MGSEVVPRLDGPDRLIRALVLQVRPDSAFLDGVEVDEGPGAQDQDSGDWKISRLYDQATLMRERRPSYPRGVIVLDGDRTLSAKDLRHYFYTLWLGEYRQVLLMVRAPQSGSYSAAKLVLLVETPYRGRRLRSGSFRARLETYFYYRRRFERRLVRRQERGTVLLPLSRFRSYEDLAREVVARRQVGQPVFLSVAE